MMVDYIVVGLGLAGVAFCEQLIENGKSFKVISDHSEQASLVASGLYNPIILKRLTLAWKADVQMTMLNTFYRRVEQRLNTTIDYKVPIYRRFASIEEQNYWFEASDKASLRQFLTPKIAPNINPNINAPYGLGEVKFTGRIDTKKLIKKYRSYLLEKHLLYEESFDFEKISFNRSTLNYKDIHAHHIIFAEGFGLKRNPYFKYLPLNGSKGELLTIKAPLLKENSIFKSSVFLIPLGEDLYRIGSTYNWKDKTNKPTKEAKSELLKKLKTFVKCDFEIVEHAAGVRPTVSDRRPLVGRHPKNTNLYVLNGFGSRGVLIAPYASDLLFKSIENTVQIDPEMDIKRFAHQCF